MKVLGLPPLHAAGISALLSLWAEVRFRRLPVVPLRETTGDALPSLTVVVPARNEAKNLPRLLRSLCGNGYPARLDTIVVDDDSMDGSGTIAAAHGAEAIRTDGPPTGWLGKPHACHLGAAAATGEWLLFTDADTCHRRGALASAVDWVTEHGLDGVSLFPKHESGAFGDRLVLAVAFAGYFAGLASTRGLLVGQYLLIRRAVYEASGGFASVRDEPLEDLALGRRLAQLGYRLPAARGEALVRVRMYGSAGQMWHGFTRLAALSLRWSGAGSVVTPAFTVLTAAPVGGLTSALLAHRGGRLALAGWALTLLGLAPWLVRFRTGPDAALAPIAAAFVQAAGVWGLLTRVLRLPIRWKGRAM